MLCAVNVKSISRGLTESQSSVRTGSVPPRDGVNGSSCSSGGNGHGSGHDEDDVLDVRGAMALLKLGRGAVYDACGRGQIPHRRIGKKIRFSRAALLRWLEGAR